MVSVGSLEDDMAKMRAAPKKKGKDKPKPRKRALVGTEKPVIAVLQGCLADLQIGDVLSLVCNRDQSASRAIMRGDRVFTDASPSYNLGDESSAGFTRHRATNSIVREVNQALSSVGLRLDFQSAHNRGGGLNQRAMDVIARGDKIELTDDDEFDLYNDLRCHYIWNGAKLGSNKFWRSWTVSEGLR